MRVGLVDVGTTSVHVVIAVCTRGRPRVVHHEQTFAALGHGGLRGHRLAPRATQRVMTVLRRAARRLAAGGVSRVEAVATSAVREATNGRAFVRRARRETGLPLRVLSGQDEASLIYAGMRDAGRCRGKMLVLSVGGGSAQVAAGQGPHPAWAVSRPLGAARLRERFLRHDPAHRREVTFLRAHVARQWRPLAPRLRRWGAQELLVGGAAMGGVIAAARTWAARHARGSSAGRSGQLSAATLEAFVAWLAISRAAQRRRLAPTRARREALWLPTGLVVQTILALGGGRRVRVIPGSLREGLLTHMGQET